jgi:alkylhydroperoxidase family enzyme
LEYADRITRDAASLTQAVIQGLRAQGLSDEEILHAAPIASYFNYINRISDALGVELEPDGGSPNA